MVTIKYYYLLCVHVQLPSTHVFGHCLLSEHLPPNQIQPSHIIKFIQFQAGVNSEVGESDSIFLFWEPKDENDPVYTVNAIGLGTVSGVEGVWMIGRHGCEY